MVKAKKVYSKPVLRSSKIKTVQFYSRNSLRNSADTESLLLAGVVS